MPLAVIALTGCSQPDLTKVEWEALAKQRAQERWQALIDGRLETAYEYLSPGYRQAVPFAKYSHKVHGVGLWKSAEAKKATCDEIRCVVTTELEVEVRNPRLGGAVKATSPVEERWVKDREVRQLWFVPNK